MVSAAKLARIGDFLRVNGGFPFVVDSVVEDFFTGAIEYRAHDFVVRSDGTISKVGKELIFTPDEIDGVIRREKAVA